ncbi:class I SAM-dependent methyltransferase [Bacteroidota bacterium]
MSFLSTKKNWEGFAKSDPLWAICTRPDKKGGRWTTEEFFQMGKTEIERILNLLKEKNYFPSNPEKALDFGCGVGRLSRSLTSYFSDITGVDVSQSMVTKALELNKDLEQVLHFVHNTENDLELFQNATYDFVFTTIVLQHIPYPESLSYIREFARILKSGGVMVFQLPTEDIRELSLLKKLRSRIKIRERMALLGIGKGYQMEMHIVPENEVTEILTSSGCEILDVFSTNHTDPAFDGHITFNEDSNRNFGYISKLFIARKN